MSLKNQTVDVYKEGTQTDWGKVTIYLMVCFFLIQLIAVFVVYYLFGKEQARMAFLVVAGIDGLLLFGGILIGIAYAFLRLAGRLINEHQAADDNGEASRIAATLAGTAELIGSAAQTNRNQVNADKLALQWMTLTQREANRLAEERGKKPLPTDDDLLKHLLGSDEPLLLTEGDDE